MALAAAYEPSRRQARRLQRFSKTGVKKTPRRDLQAASDRIALHCAAAALKLCSNLYTSLEYSPDQVTYQLQRCRRLQLLGDGPWEPATLRQPYLARMDHDFHCNFT